MTAKRRALAAPLVLLTSIPLWGLLGSAGGVWPTPPAEASSPETGEAVAVRWQEILSEGGVRKIRLEAAKEPAHELSRGIAPPSVQLAFTGATLAGFPPKVEVGDGLIDTVETSSGHDGRWQMTVRLAQPAEAEVVSWTGGIDLVLRPAVGEGSGPSGPARRAAPVARLPSGEGLSFSFGEAPSKVSSFVLSDGKRLVIDAEGVTLAESQSLQEYPEGSIVRVRLARQEGRVRSVVEVRSAGALEGYRLDKSADGLLLVLPGGAQATAPAQEASTSTSAGAKAKGRPENIEPKESEARGGGEVTEFGFRQEGATSIVDVVLSKASRHEVREASAKRVVLDVLHTRLPEKFRRALDTSGFTGPVSMVSAYSRKNGAGTDTRLVIELRDPAALRVEQKGSRLALLLEGKAGEANPPVPGVAEVRKDADEVIVVEGKLDPKVGRGNPSPSSLASRGGRETPPPSSLQPVVAREKDFSTDFYNGRRLSLDFVDADIRNVLRIIGEVSGLNVVAGDDVQGKVTVRLVDVPWDQCLDVILRTRGLDLVKEGNVLRIAPADRLAQEKAKAREMDRGLEEKSPLVSDILHVNYASAQELQDKVKAVLTQRGSVAVDQRTNTILIKDLPAKIEEARNLVARLDTPTPQVLIEARIVEVSSTFSRDLGVQWGGKFSADTAHGNATNWSFPNSVRAGGDTGLGNFAVNFPAAIAPNAGTALSLKLGHINDILSLDLRLSALESSGRGRVVSSPRVATLDNRMAEIAQGVSIPFTTSTQEKIETQSIDYLLKLNVTPHVTADRSIIMKIDVKKDSPSTTFRAVDSNTPAKETRSATTEVLVKDGETTVIGGIITDQQGTTVRGVPFLSKIPVLGWLFQGKTTDSVKTELIIFITPKIATPTAVARNP
jgi:type IV pilus assembly protein PilQ